MAHEYPPKITGQTFAVANPPLLGVVGACPLNNDRCGVSYLRLQGTQLTGFQHGDVIDLASVANGRSRFAPNVDQLTIEWAFTGHQFITAARLEVFAAGIVGAVWTHTFNWGPANARQANGNVAFKGQLANTGPNGEFPESFLTVTHAPYQVSLTIVSVENNTEVTCGRRWFYLDVVVDRIELDLGAKALIPVQDVAFAMNRYLMLNEATYDAVAAQLTLPQQVQPEALTSANAPAELEIGLGTNIFARSSRDFYDNTIFAAMRQVWRGDPMLPVIAHAYVQQNDGQRAPLVKGAAALGGLELLWDWVGGDGTLANAHNLPAAYVRQAVAYKPDVWPRAGRNCHVDHGGKRGGGTPMFRPIRPPNAAADLFTTAAVNNRPWAISSSVVSDPNDANAGKTGVLFFPSRIAGDEYRLTVYPALPGRAALNVARASAFDPLVANLPVARSPKLTVWKVVTVARHWSKHATADSALLNWVTVNGFFAPARVRLVAPAQVSLIDAVNGGADYHQAFNAIAPSLIPAHRYSVDRTVQNQIKGDYGFRRSGYQNFVNQVDAHVQLLQQLVTQAAPNTADGVRQAQAGPLNTNSFSRKHLYLDRVADIQATIQVLRTRALARLGIDGPNTYAANALQWGEDVLARVAAEFQRNVTPDMPGLHLFEFQFTDNAFSHPNTAAAVTTISNRINCVRCGNALPALAPETWRDADEANNRICGNCPTDQSDEATILSYVPFRYIDGQLDDWGRRNLSLRDQLTVTVGAQYGTSASIAIAHEIGHQLGLPHAPPEKPKVMRFITAITTGGIKPEFHDRADETCMMSYNVAYANQLHFCGVCVLRLRGWSAGPSDVNTQPRLHAQDHQTIALSNAGLQNSGIGRANGAVWDPDAATANCTRCNTAFSTTVRKHHCRRCGHIFCSNCASQTAPVRNPLTSNGAAANPPVQEVKVCIPCHAVWTAPD